MQALFDPMIGDPWIVWTLRAMFWVLAGGSVWLLVANRNQLGAFFGWLGATLKWAGGRIWHHWGGVFGSRAVLGGLIMYASLQARLNLPAEAVSALTEVALALSGTIGLVMLGIGRIFASGPLRIPGGSVPPEQWPRAPEIVPPRDVPGYMAPIPLVSDAEQGVVTGRADPACDVEAAANVQAYQDGRAAHVDGKSLLADPFPSGDPWSACWHSGWLAAWREAIGVEESKTTPKDLRATATTAKRNIARAQRNRPQPIPAKPSRDAPKKAKRKSK